MCEDDLFCGVNKTKAAGVEDMPDLEKKHTPVIEAPTKVKRGESFNVTVEVGKLLKHPNENAHFIEWLELYSGDTFLTRIDFVPRLTDPKAVVSIALDHAHPLVARTRCNLHGVWESFQVDIDVE